MSKAIEKLRKLREGRDMDSVKEMSQRKTSYEGKGQKEKVYKDNVKVKKASDVKGDFVFRIFPPSFESDSPTKHWGFPINTHYEVGPDNKIFNCPRDIGKKCPSCEYAMSLEDKEQRGQYYPGYGALVWIIDRGNEKDGPIMFRMPFSMENDILKEVARADIKNIDDEFEGFDIIVSYNKEPGKRWGKWSKPTIVRNSSPISDDEEVMEDWLEFIMENPLNEIPIYHSYKVIEEAMQGNEEDEEEKEEPKEEKPTPKKTFKKKFKKF